MHDLLNVLYVQTQGTLLRLDHDAIEIRSPGKPPQRFPLRRFSHLVLFGRVSITPNLIRRCGENGPNIVWMTQYGHFSGQLDSPISGNVLLRRQQHTASMDTTHTLTLARQIVAGKLQNSRHVLLRSARETTSTKEQETLTKTANHIAESIKKLREVKNLDTLRGIEGENAKAYFNSFSHMVKSNKIVFQMVTRTRRPPRDRLNALLSFLYALLQTTCKSACESVGLDPQVGFLHALRPGRPALALDLMEEFHPAIADKLALTLINRNQITSEDFKVFPGGAVYLTETGRKKVLIEFEKHKQKTITHKFTEKKENSVSFPTPKLSSPPDTYEETSTPTRPISADKKTEILVYHDISTKTKNGEQRLRKIAKICEGFSQRVQKSVFECITKENEKEILITQLNNTINKEEDTLHIYQLREPHHKYTHILGKKNRADLHSPIIL